LTILPSDLKPITSGNRFSGLSLNYGLKGYKGMAKEPPPKQTWIQLYLPGLDPNQPVELILPEDQDEQGI
ncbi:MAG: hypothetical protein EBS53_10085, partial [Bacteroidetes bacterium]|nr:hypothetical protein [Bacteroidota bacterium]